MKKLYLLLLGFLFGGAEAFAGKVPLAMPDGSAGRVGNPLQSPEMLSTIFRHSGSSHCLCILGLVYWWCFYCII